MTAQQLLYLSRADVERVALDMPTVIQLLEAAFLEKGQGRVEMPPKPGIHPQPDAFIHAMPAYIPALRAAGLKWVSGQVGSAHQFRPRAGRPLVGTAPLRLHRYFRRRRRR